MSGDKESRNRGHAAEIGRGGDVKGSGAAAGGAGAPEDYDADPQAGGGKPELPIDKSDAWPSHN